MRSLKCGQVAAECFRWADIWMHRFGISEHSCRYCVNMVPDMWHCTAMWSFVRCRCCGRRDGAASGGGLFTLTAAA